MDETLARLEAEYCPPIDPALLSAILSDYDLSNQDDVQSARSTLHSLKEHALLEEAAGFDASGTGGLEEDVTSAECDESHAGTSTSRSRATDSTSLSNHFSSLDLEDNYVRNDLPVGETAEFEKLDEDAKVQLLEEVFGKHVNKYTIQYTLQKCNGNWQAAMEELLNHAYFADAANGEDGVFFTAKGIEGFAEENLVSRGRKGKSKNKRFKGVDEKRSSSLPVLHDSEPAHTTNAWESASQSATRKENHGGIQIVPLYARPDMDADSDQNATGRKAKSALSSRSPSSDSLSAATRKDLFDLARAAALSQANAARRKAKSDHLMSGAAAYYSEIGREYAVLSAKASSQAADHVVASQSSATHLDLHGIDVQNAVRIARERVEMWWDSLGESRVNGRVGAEERQSGFRIVVGLGRHSEGGRSKLGPAVMKMLKQEGWRVEPAGGEILVEGRAKK